MSDSYKTALRHTLRQIRTHLPEGFRRASSKEVCLRIHSLDQYRRAKRVAFYQAVSGEIDLTSLWNSAFLESKFCYFPVLQEDKTLLFLPATSKTAFKKNNFGIFEPDVGPDLALPVNELDLMIMPLLAFDEQGTRLGMGAGYYDRTLSRRENVLLVGVGYSFQRVHYLEPNPWDVALDLIITPKTVYVNASSSTSPVRTRTTLSKE